MLTRIIESKVKRRKLKQPRITMVLLLLISKTQRVTNYKYKEVTKLK